MLELQEWLDRTTFPDKPWLVLGKGPTLDLRHGHDLSAYNRLALNHVVNVVPSDIAHVIDVDVIPECADALRTNCKWLVMPRYPHLNSEPCDRALEDWFDEHPVLREVDGEGRLVWYNLNGGPLVGRSPVISAKRFSSEAAFGIVGRLGAKQIRTIGIDGGRGYGSEFAAVAQRTMLANGALSFDEQHQRLQVIADEFGIESRPLIEPLRIFVGTDESQIVAFRVLEYSIRQHTTYPIEVVPMLGLEHPMPKDPVNKPRTTFSYNRFQIPELCGYRGRALYLDADMLVFADVAELATMSFDGHSILCTTPAPTEQWEGHGSTYLGLRSPAVLLLDCSRLKWDIEEIVRGLDEHRYTYSELFSDLCVVDPSEIGDTLPNEWNDLERFDPNATKLLHYTVVPTQPWKVDDNPLGEIWMSSYREAVAAGAVPPEEVEAAIAANHVKPSLRAALPTAPTRRTLLTGATLDLVSAQQQVRVLEDRLASMRASWSWRIGDAIVRTARKPVQFVRARR